jgi:hypothetical protein
MRLSRVATAVVISTLSFVPARPAQAADTSPTATSSSAATGPESIATLREDVKRTGDRLAAWERGQQSLSRLISEKIRTETTSDQLSADADAARRSPSVFASNLYKHPVDPLLYAIVSGKLTSIGDLTTIRRVQEALRLQARLDKDLALLQADASSSLTRLQAAVAELRRQQVAAALAAQYRRQADAAAALAATNAIDAIAGAGSGPACSGTVLADAINGFLPASALCSLSAAPGHRLIAPAAASFDRMSAAFAATFGTTLCITDSCRDYATQAQVFRTKPTLAATPGRSQHGWGRAVDLCGGVQTYGTPPYRWLKANAVGWGSPIQIGPSPTAASRSRGTGNSKARDETGRRHQQPEGAGHRLAPRRCHRRGRSHPGPRLTPSPSSHRSATNVRMPDGNRKDGLGRKAWFRT